MIECPNCHHKAMPGSLFCQECGAAISGIEGLATQVFPKSLTDQIKESPADQSEAQLPPPPTDAAVLLYMLDAGKTVPLEGRAEFTLGRSAEGQPILPDIDLAPYHAYESGVSRLHVTITLGKQHALATDLGSANGTRLNGQRIQSHKPTAVKHGDILTLGKLRIQLLIRR